MSVPPIVWNESRLNDVLVSLESGSRPKGGSTVSSGEIPSLGGEHVQRNGTISVSDLKLIPRDYYIKMKRGKVKKGDVLLVKDGATTGKVGIVRPDYPHNEVAVNEHVFICRVKPNLLLPEYLFYHMFSSMGQKQILNNFHGSAIGGINQDFADNYVIHFPSLAVQRKIVTILEKAEETKLLRAQANELTQKLLQSVFFEMFGEPTKNTKAWAIRKLGELGHWTSGGTPSRAVMAYFDGEIPWYTTGELNDFYLDDSIEHVSQIALESSSAKLFPPGTLLIGMYDTAALKMGILTIPSSSNQACAAFLPKKGEMDSLFALHLLKIMKPTFLSSRRGVRQKNLSQTIIKEFKVPLPPYSLQLQFHQIADMINLEYTNQLQISHELTELTNALVKQAFTGELVA